MSAGLHIDSVELAFRLWWKSNFGRDPATPAERRLHALLRRVWDGEVINLSEIERLMRDPFVDGPVVVDLVSAAMLAGQKARFLHHAQHTNARRGRLVRKFQRDYRERAAQAELAHYADIDLLEHASRSRAPAPARGRRVWGLQFVWWGADRSAWAWGRLGPYPDVAGRPSHATIYSWRFALGPLEIRRWAPSSGRAA